MSLSVAATAQSHFRRENIRRKEQGRSSLSVQEKRDLIAVVVGASRREAEHSINIQFAQPSMKKVSFEVGSDLEQKIERLLNYMAHKNFDRDLGKMIEVLVDAELIRYDKSLGINQKLDKNKEEVLAEDRACSDEVRKEERSVGSTYSAISVRVHSRYIPRKIRSLVWAKYKGKCTYKDPRTGRICESEHGIQIDHRIAFAKGGEHLPENLTLL